MPHRSDTNTSIGQFGSGQDHIVSGSNEHVSWLAVFDGHGEDTVPAACREHDWSLLGDSNPDLAIWAFRERLRTIWGGTGDTGCTASIVRHYHRGDGDKSTLRIEWIGDSEVAVWSRDEEIFHAGKEYSIHPVHVGKVTKSAATDINVVSPDLCGAKLDYYFHYPSPMGGEEVVNMDGALGHNEATDHPLRYKEIVLETDQLYHVTVGSDGLWQMMCDEDKRMLADPNVTSEELLALAGKRWGKVWIYDPNVPEEKTVKTFQESGLGQADDVSVGVMVCYPEPTEVSYETRRGD